MATTNGATDLGPTVALFGNTAVAVRVSESAVYIFDRVPAADAFVETARLTPSDGGAGFGRSVATTESTAVVGATDAVYIFERGPGGWGEVAKLSGEVEIRGFGQSVAISGTTVVVGAPNPPASLPAAAGVV